MFFKILFIFSDRQSRLFTGILPDTYQSPDTFCFDYRCSDNPIMVSSNIYLLLISLTWFISLDRVFEV